MPSADPFHHNDRCPLDQQRECETARSARPPSLRRFGRLLAFRSNRLSIAEPDGGPASRRGPHVTAFTTRRRNARTVRSTALPIPAPYRDPLSQLRTDNQLRLCREIQIFRRLDDSAV